MPVMWSRRCPIMRGVKPRLTKARSRLCCGGSMLIIITRIRSTAGSLHSRNAAVRGTEEKMPGCRITPVTSACLVTAQKPGHPGPPPSACQKTGACSRSQANCSCGAPPRA